MLQVTGFASGFAICNITVHLKNSVCLITEEILLKNTNVGNVCDLKRRYS